MDLPDPEQARVGAGWFAGAATFVGAIMGGIRLHVRGRQKLDERFEKKADKEQVANHHTAIIDLYSKHEKVSERIAELDRNNFERHIELLNAIHAGGKK